MTECKFNEGLFLSQIKKILPDSHQVQDLQFCISMYPYKWYEQVSDWILKQFIP